jgi:hypothetical protein
MQEIHAMINNVVTNKKVAQAKICDGFYFNHFDTLNRVYLYLNYQYNSGNYDSKGNRKWFFPLHEHRCYNFDKNLDIDLANILLVSRKRGDEFRTWLAQNIIYYKLKEMGFSTKVNEIVQTYSRIGNVVSKQTNDDSIFANVDLRDLYLADVTVESLQDTLTIQKHNYSQADLLAMKGSWDNVKEAVALCAIKDRPKNTDGTAISNGDYIEPYYEIYELYGEVPESWIKKGGSNEIYKPIMNIMAIGENNSHINLFQSIWTKPKPYKELHFGAYKGRWLREGIVELLFNHQERYNEVNNQIANSMRLSKKIYTTENKSKLLQNILTDLDDGAVLEGDLRRVDDTEINLLAWKNERDFINKMADDICNSFEILTGDSMPSNMPYRLGALINNNANKLYDFLREKLGIYLTEILTDWADKNLNKSLKTAEFARIVNKPEYLDFYHKFMTDLKMNELMLATAINGGVMYKEDYEQIEPEIARAITKDKDKKFPIPNGMFYDFKYDFEVVITGENYNKAAVMETGSNLLQTLGAQHPLSKNIINKLTELAGFSPMEWDSTQEVPQVAPQQPQNIPSFAEDKQTL